MSTTWQQQKGRLEIASDHLRRLAGQEPVDAASGRYALPNGR